MDLSEAVIENAKAIHRQSNPIEIIHEHDDCIRIAYQWLDAQKTRSTPHYQLGPDTKSVIARWAGRYVSLADVEVAAILHPRIRGVYPYFNLSSKLTRPLDSRLEGIEIAFSQGYRNNFDESVYGRNEK